jgi:hypothetical protein
MKLHARINTATPNTPLCSYQNFRDYKDLPQGNVLSPSDFRNADATCRCMLCEDLYLIQRNKQRLAKGLPKVASAFEGLKHK